MISSSQQLTFDERAINKNPFMQTSAMCDGQSVLYYATSSVVEVAAQILLLKIKH